MKKMRILVPLLILMMIMAGNGLAQNSSRTPITVDNAANLQLSMRLGRGSADSVAWSPDGAYILVGGSIGIWKYQAGALDTQLEPELIDVGGEVTHFAVSPTGTLAVSHSGSRELQFWDLASANLVESVQVDGSKYRLAYSADGKYISLNNGSSGMAIYDVNAKAIHTQAQASLGTNVALVFSPDAAKVVGVNSSYRLLVWDVATGGDPMQLEGHSASVDDIAISPDGSLIASASTDDSVRIWNLSDGSSVNIIQQAADNDPLRDVYSVAFSPNGATLVSGHSGKVRIWDAASGTQRTAVDVKGNVRSIKFSPDGSQFVIVTSDAATGVQLYNADGTLVATSFYHNASIYAVTFSPDSAVLAFSDSDRYLYLWDTVTAQEITTSAKVEDGATTGIENHSNITYSSDGRYLATLQSFSAMLRDPITGAVIREFSDLNGIAEDIEFSPDNTMLAVATSRGVYVFNVETGVRLFVSEAANDWLNDVTWSPDQTMLATASSDNAVRVYTIQ